MPNILDVAQHANVSVTTVSRVLNDHPSVRAKKRRLVLQAVAELGYVPNVAARGLRKSRSRTIGFVIPDLRSPGYIQTIEGIAGVVRQHGYSLLLCDSSSDASVQTANLTRLFERRVDGLLLYTVTEACPDLGHFLRAEVPVLVMNSRGKQLSVPHMVLNQMAGLKAALEYLMGLGHRRISLLTTTFLPGSARAEEFRQCALELGLPYDSESVALVSSAPECAEAVPEMLARPERPTAMIVGTSGLAPYALKAINAAGLDIPRDISFVDNSDSLWASAYRPPLTVIAHDRVARGRMAAEYIFARLAGLDGEDLLHEVRSELVVRESCAEAPR